MNRYEIGPLHLDVAQRVLYQGTEVVTLSPKSFDILLVLVENAGQVISRDAIREQVWGDAFIEDANLSNNISMLRAALREHLGDVQVIKTFSKRGYQFTIPPELKRDHESGATRIAPPAEAQAELQPELPATLPVTPRPSFVWKTKSNLALLVMFLLGLAITLVLIRSARTGTLPRRPVATLLLSGLGHANVALKSIHPLPSLLASAVLFGIAGVLAVRGRRRPDLHTGNLLLALSFIVCTQIVWTFSKETAVRDTIGMLGQLLLGLTLAAYKPETPRFKGLWLFYLDLLPLLAFIVFCGLDVKKASIYVVLSAIGRMMLLGTYVLRRDALLPILVAILGWISMALLAAAGQYRAAAYLAIAITSIYAAVNLSVRLPRENIGKPILVAGTLLWALYAATYPAAFPYAPLQPFWNLLLHLAKLLVCVGMAVFVLKARPSTQQATLPEALPQAA